MALFKSSLLRSLALGFALGSLLVALVMGTGVMTGEGSLVSVATAAPPVAGN